MPLQSWYLVSLESQIVSCVNKRRLPLHDRFLNVEFLGFFSTNMHIYKFLTILLIIYNLDLTKEFNFVRHCGQEKRNLGYCGPIILLFSLYTRKSPLKNGQ